jgi:hypothetical protein
MSLDSEITIVSGLPRSGTSLMMQMLQRGGMAVVTDEIREADVDNPRGYLELEKVKKIKEDSRWLPGTRGKAFKMVSQLLYDIPSSEKYGIIFMERDLDETLASQQKMLRRRGGDATPRDTMKQAYTLHLQRLLAWLGQQPHIRLLRVSYNNLLEQPEGEAVRVAQFLGGQLDAAAMATAVVPALYRNRKDAAAL